MTNKATEQAIDINAQVWQYERPHTRDGHGTCTYSLSGSKGRCWMSNDAMLADGAAWPDTLVVLPNGTTVPTGEVGVVLAYKGSTPNGDRHRYAAPGMVGYAQVAAAWFDAVPATLVVCGVAFADAATTAARKRATARAATSAVVATANMAHAALTGAPVATPAGEAAAVTAGADALLTAAADASKGSKGSKGKGKGKAHADAVA